MRIWTWQNKRHAVQMNMSVPPDPWPPGPVKITDSMSKCVLCVKKCVIIRPICVVFQIFKLTYRARWDKINK